MANTNRPTTSTHQQLIVPPNGDAVLGRSSNKFRYYNNFPLVEKQIGQDPKYYVKRRPPVENTGIVMSSVPGLNGVGSVYYEPVFKTMWFTNQRTVVMTNNTSTTPTEDVDRIIAPTAGTGFPETSIEAYLVGDTHYICVMATTTGNFTRIYFYSPAGTFLEEVAISAASFRGKLVFLDGYLFAAGANQRIYNSTIGNPKEWLIGANFLDAEMDRDPLLTLAKHHNHIVGFGSDTIEFFYNNANEIGSPLQRQVAYASREVGLFSHLAVGTGFGADTQPDNSLVEIGEVIYFIGSNDGICQGLYKIENFKVTKVSDHSLDLRLRETIYPKLTTFDLNG